MEKIQQQQQQQQQQQKNMLRFESTRSTRSIMYNNWPFLCENNK